MPDNYASTEVPGVWQFWTDSTGNHTTDNRLIVVPCTASEYSSSTCHTVIWSSWVSSTANPWIVTPAPSMESVAREVEYARAQEERQRSRYEERRAARQVASAKAEKLLHAHLSEEEKTELANHGHFYVTGNRGGLFRIERGCSGNVKLIDPTTRESVATLCAHPRGCGTRGIPDPDVMLAQKLMLMTDEDGFLAVANVHWSDPRHRTAFYERRRVAECRSQIRLVA